MQQRIKRQMNAKEKAKELIDKYVALTDGWVAGKNGWEHKKKCALMAVEEILNNNCGSHTDEANATNSEIYCDEYFWNDVKSELQSL
jgi:hypothetical protein